MATSLSLGKAESLLKILADKTRLTILLSLKESELCVCDIVDLLDISQPAVSQHLRKMKDLDIITEDKRGQWNYYRINDNNPQIELIHHILGSLEK